MSKEKPAEATKAGQQVNTGKAGSAEKQPDKKPAAVVPPEKEPEKVDEKANYVWNNKTKHNAEVHEKGSPCKLKGAELKSLVEHGVVVKAKK